MSDYDELFQKCAPFQLNPPYQGEEISEIRGIALPRDYIDFLRLHNGGSFSNPNADDSNRLVLFSLEEIQKGDCYRDEDGNKVGNSVYEHGGFAAARPRKNEQGPLCGKDRLTLLGIKPFAVYLIKKPPFCGKKAPRHLGGQSSS